MTYEGVMHRQFQNIRDEGWRAATADWRAEAGHLRDRDPEAWKASHGCFRTGYDEGYVYRLRGNEPIERSA